ncbi:MAG: Nitrilase/cyanide hydratase and apolipoprotein N-acyltransferase [Solirubrobacterales bacterium]|nr:Nitrilase/cyanide hydratase and apolipoprotein N-acyltransferase [Solirubrobacterales bacterium]
MPRVATVQIEPSHMDPQAGLERIRRFTVDAAAQGAEVVVFPELLVPGYPRYVPDPFPHSPEGERLWEDAMVYHRAYVENAQVIPGPFTTTIGEIARASGVTIVIGVAEADPNVRGRMWNTAVVVGADGRYLGKHRKLVAVMHERLLFDRGGPEDILVFPTEHGTIGTCICFENHQPLFRRALGRLGEEIHCALWTGPSPRDMVARGEANEQHRALGIAHALDTGTFVVISSQVTQREPEAGRYGPQWSHSGGSYIIDPFGRTLASVPDWEEGIAVADLDLELITTGRLIWNHLGDDMRDDLFTGALGELPRPADPASLPPSAPGAALLPAPAALPSAVAPLQQVTDGR